MPVTKFDKFLMIAIAALFMAITVVQVHHLAVKSATRTTSQERVIR